MTTVRAEGPGALIMASPDQYKAYTRLKDRCSVRGVLYLSDETLQVGYETANGRDMEAVFDDIGKRISTTTTYN